ncbi:hypothetical protein Tco_1357547, partial [Tanacetum coccineum]
MKVKESLNVTFDESPPPTKLSPLVDDDVGEEEAIRKNTKIVNTNDEEDESIELDKINNIKESKNLPLDQMFCDFFFVPSCNRESKGLDGVIVENFVDGEQFVTEEIIEEGNRWPNIKVRTTWDRKIIRVASMEERSPYTKIEE